MKNLSQIKILSENGQSESSAFFLRIKYVESALSFAIQVHRIFIKQLYYSHHEFYVTMSDGHMHKGVFEFVLGVKFRPSV